MDDQDKGESVTPFMYFYKTIIQSDESLDKLKLIIVVIGNLQKKEMIGLKWYPTASTITLNYFLEDASKHKSRLHQLDFIGEFIQANNHNSGLRYYANMEDAPLSDLLKQARIKTDNQLMVFSDFIIQDYPDNGISTGAYIVFYQGEPIDHCTYVTGTVYQ